MNFDLLVLAGLGLMHPGSELSADLHLLRTSWPQYCVDLGLDHLTRPTSSKRKPFDFCRRRCGQRQLDADRRCLCCVDLTG